MRVSHESIYLALFTHNTQMSDDLHKFLRTRRVRRQPRRRGRRDRRGKNLNMILITDRPTEIEDRANPGHWEGDLVMGRGHRRAIGTLVERSSRYLILLDLIDGYSAEGVNEALAAELAGVPSALRRTLTWDQGTELSSHEAFTEATGIPVYFCHPRSPWERGTNENTNGLLRGYFPKGADLAGTTRSDLDRAAYELNTRPRRTLNWLTPAERFAQLCALTP